MHDDFDRKVVPFNLSSPPTDDCLKCIEVWRNWCGNAALPTWCGSEMLLDLPPTVVPITLVADVVDNGRDFVYRFWGSGFTNMHGYDLTGQSPLGIKPPSYAAVVFESLKEVYRSQQPVLYSARNRGGPDVQLDELVLRFPLTINGESVDRILSICWLNPREAAEWFEMAATA